MHGGTEEKTKSQINCRTLKGCAYHYHYLYLKPVKRRVGCTDGQRVGCKIKHNCRGLKTRVYQDITNNNIKKKRGCMPALFFATILFSL
ncbi:MAG: hypothetical protein CVV21_00685 [Candidatus Goldiibacteriota bacterium HGW-Goldbacteria-1]|jgi:hypothetical protein|nr:MAG: hypothetical protein CVV21_00685 [Candidatus Goldiibacteriota bacterium HGW-Goldbacteria-1]